MAALTVTQVAERWSCSIKTVHERIQSGDLAAFDVGGGKRKAWRVTLAAVEAFERARQSQAPPPRVTRRRLPYVEPTFT